MFSFMRTHQRKLWLVITFLTIVSFVFFYSYRDPQHRMGSDTFATIYGRSISQSEFERSTRKFYPALGLGLTDFVSQLSGGGEQGAADFALNMIIVEHAGRELGIRPTDDEVKAVIIGSPAFQTDGQFDKNKYAMFSQRELAPRGLTDADVDDLVRNSLIFGRIKQMLDSAPAVTESEVAYISRMFQPVSGAAILFDTADFAKDAKITDAQIADFFKTNAANFVTTEWRVANYVRFPLSADAQKLEGKAKIEAQQKIADASDAFAMKAAAEGFEKAAKEAGLTVQTTLPFDRDGKTKPIQGLNITAVSGPEQALASSIFTLSPSAPVTGVIENGNEFLVANLAEVTKARPMTLDEARPAIVQQLTDTAAHAALQKAATESLAALRAAVQGGKPFAQAAAAAGLKTQTFTNLDRTDEKAPKDQFKYADAAMVLNENEITGLNPEMTGAYAVWLEKRMPIDPKKLQEHREDLSSGILTQRQNVLWSEWLSAQQKAADLHFANQDRG